MTLEKCERRGGGRVYIFIIMCLRERETRLRSLTLGKQHTHIHTLVAFDREKERDAHRILRMHIHSGRFVQISMRPIRLRESVCCVYGDLVCVCCVYGMDPSSGAIHKYA
jgi:hypothetical protein